MKKLSLILALIMTLACVTGATAEQSRMKIAVFYENIYSGVQAANQDMETVLTSLRDAGMELLYMSPDSWKRDRDTLAPLLEKLNIGIEGMHGHCYFTQDPDTTAYIEMVDLAVEAGAKNLLIVPGFINTGNTAEAIQSIVQGMQKAVDYGKEKNLPVLMEDFDGLRAPYNCIAGMQYFMNAVDGLGCAFDTGNWVMFHEDEMAAFELFADKIVTVHLKDRADEPQHPGGYANICADLTESYACAIGSGTMRIREILQSLKAMDYQGNVIVELYGCDPEFVLEDILKSIQWLRQEESMQ